MASSHLWWWWWLPTRWWSTGESAQNVKVLEHKKRWARKTQVSGTESNWGLMFWKHLSLRLVGLKCQKDPRKWRRRRSRSTSLSSPSSLGSSCPSSANSFVKTAAVDPITPPTTASPLSATTFRHFLHGENLQLRTTPVLERHVSIFFSFKVGQSRSTSASFLVSSAFQVWRRRKLNFNLRDGEIELQTGSEIVSATKKINFWTKKTSSTIIENVEFRSLQCLTFSTSSNSLTGRTRLFYSIM